MANEKLKRETEYWLDKREKDMERRLEAHEEAQRCKERFFSIDPESDSVKKAKAEWDFAIANLAKIEIESTIGELGPAILSLLAMGTEPDEVKSFMTETVNKNILAMTAKLCMDLMGFEGGGTEK